MASPTSSPSPFRPKKMATAFSLRYPAWTSFSRTLPSWASSEGRSDCPSLRAAAVTFSWNASWRRTTRLDDVPAGGAVHQPP